MEDIHNTFRTVCRGETEMEDNTTAQSASRIIDHARLGSHQEYRRSENSMKPGRVVDVPNSLEKSARRAMGAMKTRSVFKPRDESEARNLNRGETCYPYCGGDE